MSVSRAVSQGTGSTIRCSSCRQWMLRSFIASIGGITHPNLLPTLPQSRPTRRAFSAPTTRLNEARGRIQNESEREEHVLKDINSDFEHGAARKAATEAVPPSASENAAPQHEDYVPWYLQVDPPITPQENVISARQKIPDLPNNPPTLLAPLLSRLSVELGMDDLSILDLRGIDPPPALGSNLFMIVGTARSEKHLHFSADKLCRWLRTEYKLRPVPDGLLGRQELKLKLRRRAKKSRLLSAVGAKQTADTELEEGIRTGWICINVGSVEGGELPKTKEQIAREQNIVGFGTAISGSNIVVQLMTEEKRGEIDLEKLWTAVLTQSKREQDALREQQEEQENDAIGIRAPDRRNLPAKADSRKDVADWTVGTTAGQQQQARAYHTSARRLQTADVHRFVRHHSHICDSIGSDSIPDRGRSLIDLDARLESLKRMDKADAVGALGYGFAAELANESSTSKSTDERIPIGDNGSSTPFVRAFYAAIPPHPDQQHWHAHLQLLCYAHNVNHPNVSSATILNALENMQWAGLIPLEQSYRAVLVALLRDHQVSHEAKLSGVFNLLEEMEHHGYNALEPDILELLYRALVGRPDISVQPITLQTLISALGLARLKRQLAEGDIKGFWRTWHGYPRRLIARTAAMYATLFNAVAERKLEMSFGDARSIVGTYLEDMRVEQPPISVADGNVELLMAMLRAVRSVDPDAEVKEWDHARMECEGALRAAIAR